MSSSSSQNLEEFLPLYDAIPEEWEQARQMLVERVKKISLAVNNRQIANFVSAEVLSGQKFDSSQPQEFRDGFRKVINFGALPNATTKTIAHGIKFDSNFTLTNLYLSATDPAGFTAFSVQNYSLTAGPSILIRMDATNIIVTTTNDFSAYTRSFVIIEYLLTI